MNEETILRWLEEDIRDGDITTEALIEEDERAVARIVAKEDGVICGLPLMQPILNCVNARPVITLAVEDGSTVKAGETIFECDADYKGLLKAERTCLNLLQRLSGIATITASYVEAVKGTHAKILDTRKTTPGLRELEKEAVLAGGGHNHRIGLYDQFLIKENHLSRYRSQQNPFQTAIQMARMYRAGITVTVEVQNLSECLQALEAFPDNVLLDNMPIAEMREAVKQAEIISPNTRLEASGGVTLDQVRMIAESGVHRISVGALTHSVKSLDLSMLIDYPD